jgi:membrane fusion protein (multidrug efflux system)
MSGCGGSEEGGPGKPASPADVGYIEVQPQAVDRSVPLPGRVVAYQVAEIRPQVSGIIQSRLFEEGSYVKEGQQLYQIDAARYEADYDLAQATLENAEARRLNAQSLAERSETLVKDNAISEQEYDNAVSALSQAKAAVSMAKAEVRMAKINLDYTEVRSPISGFIGPTTVTKGALVTERQAAPLATVRQLDPVYIDLSQSAAAAGDLRERLTAARLENDGEAKFEVKLFPTKTDETYPHKGTLDAAELAVTLRRTRAGHLLRLREELPDDLDLLYVPYLFQRSHGVRATRMIAEFIGEELGY